MTRPRSTNHLEGQPGRDRHRRLGGARPGRHRPAGGAAGDGRQGGPLPDRWPGCEAFPICLAARDPDEIVRIVQADLAQLRRDQPGGYQPRRAASRSSAKLREALDMPVFHDDQHGTAIVVAAGADQRAASCAAAGWATCGSRSTAAAPPGSRSRSCSSALGAGDRGHLRPVRRDLRGPRGADGLLARTEIAAHHQPRLSHGSARRRHQRGRTSSSASRPAAR